MSITAKKQSQDIISSNTVDIEVFPIVNLNPEDILIFPGGWWTIQVIGGPEIIKWSVVKSYHVDDEYIATIN